MKKIILFLSIAIINLFLIGCYSPERKVKSVTNDYYKALVNENYEKAFETVYLYDFLEDKHPTDGTTLSEKEARAFYFEKINVLKENNYKIKGFEITHIRKEDGATAFAEVTLDVEVDGESFERHELVDEWEGKAWIITEDDPYGKYRDGKINFDIEQELEEDGL